MIAIALALLAASPCDAKPAVPAVPRPSAFACPDGTVSEDKGGGVVGCRTRDGRFTGDELVTGDRGGSVFRPDGLNVGWEDGQVTFFRTEKQGKPVGVVAAYVGGVLRRHEVYDADSKLVCARHFEGGRLVRSAEAGVWTWLDAKGRALTPKTPLSEAELTTTIKENSGDVKFCYEKRLQEIKGDLRGTVTVGFDVKDGNVKNVTLEEDTLHDVGVTDCIVSKVQKWRFRPASEEASVAFPSILKPAAESK